MMVFPVGYTGWISLHDWSVGDPTSPRFVGLANYGQLLTGDSRFLRATLNTASFTLASVAIEFGLGFAMALVFSRPFRGRGIARTAFLLPMMATPVATSLVWLMMFNPTAGLLNFLLTSAGLPPSLWVADPRLAMPSLVLVDVWHWSPLIMLILLAGLAALPRDPYESAMIDGASSLQQFRYLTLPLVRPAIVVALLFRAVDALKTFDTIFVITGGGPAYATETLSIYAFSTGFLYFNMGYASAMLVILFALVLVLCLALLRFRRSGS